MLVINPGNKVASGGNGWTNTLEVATKSANEWLQSMHSRHIRDVEIVSVCGPDDGSWTFTFEHSVTGCRATLDIHGIDNMTAYANDNRYPAKIYWNRSSTANPQLTDFLCDGYEICIRKKQE